MYFLKIVLIVLILVIGASQVLVLQLQNMETKPSHFKGGTSSYEAKEVARKIESLEERIKNTEDEICGEECQKKLRELFNEMETSATSFPARFY